MLLGFCRLQGAQDIEKKLIEKLGIHIGETTADGMFTLGEMECMGACVNAPMIAIAGLCCDLRDLFS